MTTDSTEPTPPESLPQYLVDGLPKQDVETLEEVDEFIDELLEYRRQSVDVDDLPDETEPIDDRNTGKGTLVKERVKCGADCTCNDGAGHGPYLYRYYWEDGALTSEYVGKP